MSNQQLTRDQALKLITDRAKAQDDLVTFSRIIDIPAVPVDGDTGDEWTIVDTPLADHHLLTLYALQSMTCDRLLYDPDDLHPITLPTVRGLAITPRGGSFDGGVSKIDDMPPLENHQNIPNNGTLSPRSGNITGGRPCNTVESSLKTASLPEAQKVGGSSIASSDLTLVADLIETGIVPEGVLSPDSQERTPYLLTGMPPEESSELTDTEKRSSGSSGHTQTDFSFRHGENVNPFADPELKIIDGDIPEFYTDGIRYSVCRRVMIMQPPGSAKSTYGSVVFPAHEMGRRSGTEIILTGWGDPICRRHGKRARKICESDLYRGIFNTGLDKNTRAAEDWALENESTYKSSGINSGVAGFRCDGLIWDDLTKNRKEADSEGIRNDVYNAYIDDARSRKKPDAWEVGIGTRWHEDEIMGRILPEGYAGESGYMRCRDGNVWLVICLAAECERTDDPLGRVIGEMIWREWFGEGYWAEKRVNPRSWGSLYQQRPAPEEGIMFKREDFKRYDTLPEGDNWISLDPAVSEEDDADDTAILIWRVDEFARLYLIERHILHVTMDKWVAVLLDKGQFYKPIEIVGEAGVIRRSAEPWIGRAMRKMKAFFMFKWVNRHANKPAMARGAQAMVANGQVFLPNNSDGDDFLDSCLRFPASKEDHDVDAFVNLCLRLEEMWEATPIKTVTEESPILTGGGIPIRSLMPPRHSKKDSIWKLN